MRRFIAVVTQNPVSLIGVALTTASVFLIVILVLFEGTGAHGNPYIGILAFLILPGFFVAGLALIPTGLFWDRRKARRAAARGEEIRHFPVIDLNRDTTRRVVLAFVLLTVANLVILAFATFKGVEVMETTEFCGATCHSVMAPEYTAYDGSPHSRVKCVECHIGPGADWFVKSKLSGAWQVVSVNFSLYQRPIPTPIHNLRPARETCEQCHWPSKFVGDRLRVQTHYDSDEENTELKTVLLLRVGGVEGRKSHGIHWHVDPNNEIRYRSDPSREAIYDVELTLPDGTVKTYLPPGGEDGPEPEESEWRVMDCVDCHNRPTHVFGMPESEVDSAIQEGFIDRSLPYIRRESVKALREDYPSHDAAREGIASDLQAFYQENYADVAARRGEALTAAIEVLGDIYSKNIFPSMNLTWGTYPNHIGHTHYDGCFRCHNDEHASAGGEVISQDCSTCHTLLAMEEENPEVLEMLQP
jgi:nitrate/TMAO reductase-like tetraheme cytochrome c subunit